MTMSVVSMSSMSRCTTNGTPLASGIGPTVSPTISMRNGARVTAPVRPESEAPFMTS